MNFVKALNEIHPNVWAMVIIVGGIVLYCCHKPDVASGLLGGGFMLMRGYVPSPQGITSSVTKVESVAS